MEDGEGGEHESMQEGAEEGRRHEERGRDMRIEDPDQRTDREVI